MPTRKLPDPVESTDYWFQKREAVCHDSDHNPASHRVFEPGRYEHECPTCHKIQYFVIRRGYALESSHCTNYGTR